MQYIHRGIYRTVELADGWNGKVIQTQSLFSTFPVLKYRLGALTSLISCLRRRHGFSDDVHSQRVPPWPLAQERRLWRRRRNVREECRGVGLVALGALAVTRGMLTFGGITIGHWDY